MGGACIEIILDPYFILILLFVTYLHDPRALVRELVMSENNLMATDLLTHSKLARLSDKMQTVYD